MHTSRLKESQVRFPNSTHKLLVQLVLPELPYVPAELTDQLLQWESDALFVIEVPDQNSLTPADDPYSSCCKVFEENTGLIAQESFDALNWVQKDDAVASIKVFPARSLTTPPKPATRLGASEVEEDTSATNFPPSWA